MTAADPQLFDDDAFIAELGQLRATAVLRELLVGTPHLETRYSAERLVRNLTALSRQLADGQGATTSDEALITARAWESVATVGEYATRDRALLAAATMYELAGYQSNAACLARAISPPPYDIRPNMQTVAAAFIQRLFVQVDQFATPAPPDEAVIAEEFLRRMAEAGGIQALRHASRFFLSGDEDELARCLLLLGVAVDGFRTGGFVAETNTLAAIERVIPLMAERSTWNSLHLVTDHPRWKRYLKLLARGLGQPMLRSRSVSELWPSQRAAVAGGLLNSTSSLVIKMPTSSGKTRVAELAIVKTLIDDAEARCIYVAPYRALVAEIQEGFANLFTDLGLASSSMLGGYEDDEYQEQSAAQSRALILTPEKLDLLERLHPETLDHVRLVVLDEGQIVGDRERGRRYDLLVTRMRARLPQSRFLFLSAVVPEQTLQEFAQWLRAPDEQVVRSQWRPALLRVAGLHWAGDHGDLRFRGTEDGAAFPESVPSVVEQRIYEHVGPETGYVRRPRFPESGDRGQVVAALAYEMAEAGPVLIFTPEPRLVESTGTALLRRIELEQLAYERVKPMFARPSDRPSASYEAAVEWLGANHKITRLLERGIGVHHGPLPDPVRSAVEQDFRSGSLRVLIATATLAQGVNLPVRTVIVHSSRRWVQGQGRERMRAREYWNIAGRAGRAGEETEGMVVHLVMNESDQADLDYFLRHREEVEPVDSALLDMLTDLVTGRISPDLASAQLDPALLALLVEEVADPSTLPVAVLDETLCAVQAARRNRSLTPLRRVVQSTAQRIVNETPDVGARRVFASTGLSSASCIRLREHAELNAALIQGLLPTADLGDTDDLTDLFLDALAGVTEMVVETDYADDYGTLVNNWLSGMAVSDIADQTEGDPEAVATFVEQFVAYRLPWGVSSYLRIVQHRYPQIQLSSTTQSFAAMLKYGVPSPEAAWAHAAGVTSRAAASLLGEIAVSRADVSDAHEFRVWLSGQQPELLADELGVSGQALRETARAVLRSRPNPLIDQWEEGSLLPRRLTVRVLRRVTDATAQHVVHPGARLNVVRDYDSSINRNSVAVASGRTILAYLPWDLSIALAPEMDTGLSLVATVNGIGAGEGGLGIDITLRGA